MSREIHGESKTRLYGIWQNMRERCTKELSPNYPRYGGRGIAVCDEWQNSFISFRDWALSHGYSDDLTIDRIDNDGNYSPENCQWITRSENSIKKNSEYRTRKLTENDFMAKMGRPTKNPRKNRLELRLSDEDIQMLETCAKITGLSKSDVIRRGIEAIYKDITK